MDPYTVFPNSPIEAAGPVARTFLGLDLAEFHGACRYVHELPYGYNSNRDAPMSLFKEHMGSCTTKHAVIALLAVELHLPIEKRIGIYAMTEDLVTGTESILKKYELPYVPMVHCFLGYDAYRVDLSEGNANGKNGPVDHFLYTETVKPDICAKDEYLLYRRALKEQILSRSDLIGVEMKRLLKAREDGLTLLRAKVRH